MPALGVELWLVAVSLAAAVALVRSGVVRELAFGAADLKWPAVLIAGILYSSIFTVAPAAIALGTLAQQLPLWQVAILGGIGAMIGDLVVFQFLRSAMSRMLMTWATSRRRSRRVVRLPVRWGTMLLGALIVASPLPDEVGLALLGISHLPIRWLLPLLFILNGFGIVLIGLAGRSLA